VGRIIQKHRPSGNKRPPLPSNPRRQCQLKHRALVVRDGVWFQAFENRMVMMDAATGAVFADLDHDGDEDLLSVNGHVYPQATKSLRPPDSPERIAERHP